MAGKLGWTPSAIWAATPREIAFAIEGYYGHMQRVSPPDRSTLERLCALFPDTPS